MLEVANIVAKHFPGTEVRPAHTKDTVQRDAKNEPDTWILNWWRPEITLEQGIADIVRQMRYIT